MKWVVFFWGFLGPAAFWAQSYIAGETYFGVDNYIEYTAGNLPVILAAPHGGSLEPTSIPDRKCSGCTTVKDAFTEELAREINQVLYERTGCHAHLIINRLHRKKLDANRAIGEAANGNQIAELSWEEFHEFIEMAKDQVTQSFQKGLFLDLHGHGHDIQRIELGYLLSKATLQLNDEELNGLSNVNRSSIRYLASNAIDNISFAKLIRGPKSFGGLLEGKDYPAVPSNLDPSPLIDEAYFSGGYNTARHGSRSDGVIDAIQIECNQSIRFEKDARMAFAVKIADVILEFLTIYYLPDLAQRSCTAVATDHIQRLPIRAFPNPVKNLLTLDTKWALTRIQIYDLLGQLLKTVTDEAFPLSIDLSELPAGTYVLEVFGEKNASTRQLIFKL